MKTTKAQMRARTMKYTFHKQIESGEWVVMEPQFIPLAAKDVLTVTVRLNAELGLPVRAFREMQGGLGRLVAEAGLWNTR
jgi:hypothetical protein